MHRLFLFLQYIHSFPPSPIVFACTSFFFFTFVDSSINITAIVTITVAVSVTSVFFLDHVRTRSQMLSPFLTKAHVSSTSAAEIMLNFEYPYIPVANCKVLGLMMQLHFQPASISISLSLVVCSHFLLLYLLTIEYHTASYNQD